MSHKACPATCLCIIVLVASVIIVRHRNMESVIKSNTKDMRNIVTRLEDKLKDKNEEIVVLERKIIKLEKENKMMGKNLKLNEEDIKYLVKVNHPLEKAYRSLQRKYQMAADELEVRNKNICICHWIVINGISFVTSPFILRELSC